MTASQSGLLILEYMDIDGQRPADLDRVIHLPTAFPPPCLALAQKSVQKSFENRAKLARIEAPGTSRDRCGALLGFPSAQRAKNIQNVSSWTALWGPSKTPNLSKLGRRRPNASQNCVQNLMSESCSKLLLKSDKKVTKKLPKVRKNVEKRRKSVKVT